MTQTDERVLHTTIFQLSHFVSQIKSDDLPASVRRMARLCTLDLIAAAVAGFKSTSAEAARKFAYRFFPTGPCSDRGAQGLAPGGPYSLIDRKQNEKQG